MQILNAAWINNRTAGPDRKRIGIKIALSENRAFEIARTAKKSNRKLKNMNS